MSKSIEVWVVERDKALETRDVQELIEFMQKWADNGIYEQKIVDDFKKAAPKVQLGSMCKMIMNCTKISKETKKWAKDILDQMGWSYEVYAQDYHKC